MPCANAAVFAAVLLLSLATASAEAAGPSAAAESPRSVVVLYDENKDFSGLALLDESIRATLKAGTPAGLDVFTEYMDVSRFQEPGYDAKLRDFYRQKYGGKRI